MTVIGGFFVIILAASFAWGCFMAAALFVWTMLSLSVMVIDRHKRLDLSIENWWLHKLALCNIGCSAVLGSICYLMVRTFS